jgi:hypothetical protein
MSESQYKEFGRPLPFVIHLRPACSILHVTPSFKIHGAEPPPNRWWRFWQWALLGWRWERL